MYNKILNTNMGLGFQRGRKYDTDLDRLGRMETSHSELRKTGELNMQKELKKIKKTMNTYSVKRFSKISQKNYGLGDVAESVGNGLRDAAGTTLETGGKLLDNGVAKGAGFVTGLAGMGTGASVGSSIGGAVGSLLGPLGTAAGSVLGGIGGALATPFLAAKGVETAGKTLKSVGQDIHT